ncbi:FkbM family methyltransferase [Musicola paradisiaca]|uniref:Methyltransferase FkbM family n=1 Tax=Musicola paradisiaca (strain Ech703) TaxID=579405 RepID=C6C769_MUSP7|nr:FkbM family methyltransferase [Musicola paradisiaca]ACS87776.1 methyltransferase FkbM family [Musicola paradisiaca Ech703]
MLRKIRELIFRVIGLNRIRSDVDELRSEIRQSNIIIDEMRTSINELMHKINHISSNNSGIEQINLFDGLIQKRLDEKLGFYFRWRLPVQFSEQGQTFIHTNDGHRLFVDTKEPFMTLHLLEHGEWETPVRRELQRLLSPGSTFIDVGANIGLHTLYATTLIGESGRIIALEPHPVTRALFRENLEINGLLDRVTISPLAISNEDNSTVLFEYFVEHPAMSGLRISKEILEKFNGTIERTEVNTITIDTLVSQHGVAPDLIKIDVEGFEYSVLEGCRETINNYPQVRFLMEYEKVMAESVMRPGIGSEIAHFFESKGFHVYRVDANELHAMSYIEFSNDSRGDYVFSRQPCL